MCGGRLGWRGKLGLAIRRRSAKRIGGSARCLLQSEQNFVA